MSAIKERIFFVMMILYMPAGYTQVCNCVENYEALNKMIKADYPGYLDKTRNKMFLGFYDSLHRQIEAEKNIYQCYLKLSAYINFFKDRHLSFGMNANAEMNRQIADVFSNIKNEITPLSDDTFSDIIKGTWELNTGSYYRIKISGSVDKGYTGIILKADNLYWFPGQLKVFIRKSDVPNQYTAKYFIRDHSSTNIDISVINSNLIDFGSNGLWQRVGDSSQNSEIKRITKQRQQVVVRRINDNALYIRIPSFDIQYYEAVKKVVDSLKQVQMTSNLVLDVRDNNGGSKFVSNLLLDYVYTKPIKMPGYSVKTSERNIRDLEGLISNSEINTKFDTSELRKDILEYKKYPDSLYPSSADYEIKMDSIYTLPNKVFILINRFSASATELFLLQALQSHKVILVGENTRGAIDYVDVGSPHALPCEIFFYRTPRTRSNRVDTVPIDGIGISPTIQIPSGFDALLSVEKLLGND